MTDDVTRQYQAAWGLLEAVRELFPEKFAELEAIRHNVHWEYATGARDFDDLDFDDPSKTLPDTPQKCVWDWIEKNGISCYAVYEAAIHIASGESRDDLIRVRTIDENGLEVKPPSPIQADSLNEPMDKFLARAARHYHLTREFWQEWGFKSGGKREYEHFRYLAVHRVGGYTWEQIQEGKALGEDGKPFKFPSKSLKTIAGEARKLAKLLGLAPDKRGRRPGSRDKRRRKHVVRRS